MPSCQEQRKQGKQKREGVGFSGRISHDPVLSKIVEEETQQREASDRSPCLLPEKVSKAVNPSTSDCRGRKRRYRPVRLSRYPEPKRDRNRSVPGPSTVFRILIAPNFFMKGAFPWPSLPAQRKERRWRRDTQPRLETKGCLHAGTVPRTCRSHSDFPRKHASFRKIAGSVSLPIRTGGTAERRRQDGKTSDRGIDRPGRRGEARTSCRRNSAGDWYVLPDRRKTWTVFVSGSTIQYSGTPERS